MTRSFFSLLLLFSLAWSPEVFAATLAVPSQHPTVQAAIDAATPGDEIVVSPGTYLETISIGGKDLTLRSTDPTDATVVEATILDASLSGSVITFEGTETASCLIAGFTIQNGSAVTGGGFLGNESRATIQHNRIRNNRANAGGGFHQCDGLIEHNEIFDNLAYGAGGGAFYRCDGKIYSNFIHDNEADFDLPQAPFGVSHGGGFVQCNASLVNNVITRNFSDGIGGGFYFCGGGMLHNTIYNNGPFQNFSGGIGNSILWGVSLLESSAPKYCIVGSESLENSGEGNLFTHPRLMDPSNGDYRPRPDSPAIDAGSLFYSEDIDIEGNARPYDATTVPRGDDYDIGAYEFIGMAEPNPIPSAPINLSPTDGSTVTGFNPLLVSSPFSDGDPTDTHTRSEWQVSPAPTFVESNLVSWFTSYDENLLQEVADPFNGNLPAASQFWWRVRHRDNYAAWSAWSTPTSFFTRGSGIIHVPEDYPTIQQALNSATPGDEVVVAPGTYTEALVLDTENITLRSQNPLDATTVASTLIHGPLSPQITLDLQAEGFHVSGLTIQGAAEGIHCHHLRNSTIENCMITSGKIYQLGFDSVIRNCKITVEGGLENCHGLIQGNEITNGRGIFSSLIVPCEATVAGNHIAYNHSRGVSRCKGLIKCNTIVHNTGGGLFDCNGSISDNVISHNVNPNGSAGLRDCNGLIEGNIISHNAVLPTGRDGGGLVFCNGTIQNNLICFNSAPDDGGGLGGCNGSIRNNTVYGNEAGDSGGGIIECHGELLNNIIWGNTASLGAQIYDSTNPMYSCIQDWEGGGVGNISTSPLFLDPDGEDFRLTLDSPCIDSGGTVDNISFDFWGDPRTVDATLEPRGDGSNIDIGADEVFLSFYLSSDIYKDRRINYLDLFSFSSGWQRTPDTIDTRDVDFNHLVDSLDLLILLTDWGASTGPN
jgi:hypothetical protein